jgi:hypothetical protein
MSVIGLQVAVVVASAVPVDRLATSAANSRGSVSREVSSRRVLFMGPKLLVWR